MATTDFAYIASKVAHMRRFGIPAGLSERTGAAQPAWRVEVLKEEGARHAHQLAVRRRREDREATEARIRAARERFARGEAEPATTAKPAETKHNGNGVDKPTVVERRKRRTRRPGRKTAEQAAATA